MTLPAGRPSEMGEHEQDTRLGRLHALAPQRFIVDAVEPEIDGGRYPLKQEVGDEVTVLADLVTDGHNKMAAAVLYREEHEEHWHESPMRLHDNDRWVGSFEVERNGRYRYSVAAWIDEFETLRQDLTKKFDAGQAIDIELREGREMVVHALERAEGEDRGQFEQLLHDFDRGTVLGQHDVMLSPRLTHLMHRYGRRVGLTRYHKELEVVVDPVKARFAAWYEMFWRSQGTDPSRSATVDECIARFPYIRELGFDVVYLVPIHPIGHTNRKGKNNSLVAGPDDPGSPYAIGSEAGGHKAINPDWGTLDDFRRFVHEAEQHGLAVAIDFAIQCSPDHPWIKQHPDWFKWRPDGTIRFAENPPKKYEDIVNVEFYDPRSGEPIEALWLELLDVVLFWVGQGVKIFRVDNPHTKPLPFWEWLIREVQDRHPDAIFLAEAFTRPKLMAGLAKLGFTQSYSYFTWRNTKYELISYFEELTQTEKRFYMRANLFANTPDILPFILQRGGRPAFIQRAVLAATLSSVYGIYNGFEICENNPVPNKEEYLNSEKYEYKVWDWDRVDNIKDWIKRLNRIRHENPALHEYDNLRFYNAWDDNIILYGKISKDRANFVLCAVNLDPYASHECFFELPLWELGLPDWATVQIEEMITGYRFAWTGKRQHVWIDNQHPAFVWRIWRE